MKYITTIIYIFSVSLLAGCKDQPAQEAQPLKVMTFNIRLDAS